MMWLPTGRLAVVTVACPLLSGCGVPRSMALSWNWVLPVGVPAPGATGDVVAVNDTVAPNSDGFTDEDTAVVVAAGLTI